jgi:hypothetical protein
MQIFDGNSNSSANLFRRLTNSPCRAPLQGLQPQLVASAEMLHYGNPLYQHDRIGVAIVDNLRRNPQRRDAFDIRQCRSASVFMRSSLAEKHTKPPRFDAYALRQMNRNLGRAFLSSFDIGRIETIRNIRGRTGIVPRFAGKSHDAGSCIRQDETAKLQHDPCQYSFYPGLTHSRPLTASADDPHDYTPSLCFLVFQLHPKCMTLVMYPSIEASLYDAMCQCHFITAVTKPR